MKDTVEAMSRVSGILALIKATVQKADPELYTEIRDRLGDCQEILAVHCDCPPIWLIAGRVEDIVKNLEHSRKQPV